MFKPPSSKPVLLFALAFSSTIASFTIPSTYAAESYPIPPGSYQKECRDIIRYGREGVNLKATCKNLLGKFAETRPLKLIKDGKPIACWDIALVKSDRSYVLSQLVCKDGPDAPNPTAPDLKVDMRLSHSERYGKKEMVLDGFDGKYYGKFNVSLNVGGRTQVWLHTRLTISMPKGLALEGHERYCKPNADNTEQKCDYGEKRDSFGTNFKFNVVGPFSNGIIKAVATFDGAGEPRTITQTLDVRMPSIGEQIH